MMARKGTAGVVSAGCVAVLWMVMAPASWARTNFMTCDEMHRVYTNGISKSSAAANLAVQTGSRRPIVAPRVYRKSSHSLDADKDGTMCEIPRGG